MKRGLIAHPPLDALGTATLECPESVGPSQYRMETGVLADVRLLPQW